MCKLTADEEKEVVARVARLLHVEIDAKELAKYIRIGVFELSMNALNDKDNTHNPRLANVVFYLNKTAEILHPVMEVGEPDI